MIIFKLYFYTSSVYNWVKLLLKFSHWKANLDLIFLYREKQYSLVRLRV